VFHLELRQFPNNFCRFNLTEEQLHSIIGPWARGDWVELGERKWNPAQAKLKVLEGPELALDQLTMGRGWRNAQRHGREVTEQVLSKVAQPTTHIPGTPAADSEGLADSLGLRILSDLANERKPLHRAWELAIAAESDGSPSRSLALAERAVGRLLASGLLVLGTGDPEADPSLGGVDEDSERLRILSLIDSWEAHDGQTIIWISRS